MRLERGQALAVLAVAATVTAAVLAAGAARGRGGRLPCRCERALRDAARAAVADLAREDDPRDGQEAREA